MVEIIPKKAAREIPFKNVLLFIAGAILAAVVLSYAVLLRLEARGLLSIENFEESIFQIGDKEDKIIESSVFNYETKIKEFGGLWTSRQMVSRFFNNFEGLVHPKVWFSSLLLNPVEIEASVSGKTLNFETLEQQLIFLRSKNDLVDGFNLSNIALGDEGTVDFELTINFTPKIFEALEK